MKIYIVTARCGEDMASPVVFKSRKDADEYTDNYILNYVREVYWGNTGGSLHAEKATLYKWADENGYVFSEDYFWDGFHDAVEADVTEVEI